MSKSTKTMFKVLKYFLITVNVLFIFGGLMLILASCGTIHNISNFKYVPAGVLFWSGLTSIMFSLFGIDGAVRESYTLTFSYAISLTWILIMSIPAMLIHQILFLTFVTVCAHLYAASIKGKQQEQQATGSQVDNV